MSKLDGIKAGDRVRVTFEGVVVEGQKPDIYPLLVSGDGRMVENVFYENTVNAPTFQIARIEPALAVGEMVTWGRGVDDWEIVAIKGDDAIIYNKLRAQIMPLSDLRRA